MGFGGAKDLGNFQQGCGVNFQNPMCVFVVLGRGIIRIDHARPEPKRTLNAYDPALARPVKP